MLLASKVEVEVVAGFATKAVILEEELCVACVTVTTDDGTQLRLCSTNVEQMDCI